MNQIKRARLNAGLSQKQVAISLQVSIPTVSEWESGKKTPRADNLERLAALFQVSVDYLLGREEAKKEPAAEYSDEAKKIYEILSQLNHENQKKLLELATMYVENQNKNKGKT